MLGYAGMGLVEALLCTILAIYAILRIFWADKVHQQLSFDLQEDRYFEVVTWASHPSISEEAERGRPSQKNIHSMPTAPSPHPSCHAVTTSRPPSATFGRVAASIPPLPALSPSDSEEGGQGLKKSFSVRQFHLPFEFTAPSASNISLGSPSMAEKDHIGSGSGSSSTMPVSAPIESHRHTAPSVHTHNADINGVELSDCRYGDNGELPGTPSPIIFCPNPSPIHDATGDEDSLPREVGYSHVHFRPYRKRRTHVLPSEIWRLLLFQAYVAIPLVTRFNSL